MSAFGGKATSRKEVAMFDSDPKRTGSIAGPVCTENFIRID